MVFEHFGRGDIFSDRTHFHRVHSAHSVLLLPETRLVETCCFDSGETLAQIWLKLWHFPQTMAQAIALRLQWFQTLNDKVWAEQIQVIAFLLQR